MKQFFIVSALILLSLNSSRAQQSVTQALAPEFSKVALPNLELVEIASGHQFTEGPVWIDSVKANGYLLFSDIPANRIYRWRNESPNSVWREPSGKSNGLIRVEGGLFLACEHGNRRVSLTGKNG